MAVLLIGSHDLCCPITLLCKFVCVLPLVALRYDSAAGPNEGDWGTVICMNIELS